jgi:hypothetical protein
MSDAAVEAKKAEIEKGINELLKILVQAKTILQQIAADAGELAVLDVEAAKAILPKMAKAWNEMLAIVQAMNQPQSRGKN